MEIIEKPQEWKANRFPLFMALGSFDGVHRGHRKLISTMVRKAAKSGAKSAVFTLDPHPRHVLTPGKAPPLLTGMEKKQELMEELAVDYFIVQPFNHHLSALKPEVFVKTFFLDTLKVRKLFVGHDYRFGHRASGNVDLLEKLGKEYGFEVEVLSPVTCGGQVISSTRIRKLVARGEMRRARRLLGYPFSVRGPIISGQSLATAMGFPTANLQWPSDIVAPHRGVYVVQASLDDKKFNGVANIGICPTFKSHNNEHTDDLGLEVHLFNFSGQIYGCKIEINFLEKIRGERDFGSQEKLICQIKRDIDEAHRRLSGYG